MTAQAHTDAIQRAQERFTLLALESVVRAVLDDADVMSEIEDLATRLGCTPLEAYREHLHPITLRLSRALEAATPCELTDAEQAAIAVVSLADKEAAADRARRARSNAQPRQATRPEQSQEQPEQALRARIAAFAAQHQKRLEAAS